MLNMQPTQAGRARRNGRKIVSSFAVAMMLAAAIPLAASNAKAASEGKVDSLSFELSTTSGIFLDGEGPEPIRVVSEGEDNKKWTNLLPNEITFDGKVQLDMKGGGKIREFGIYLGACGRGQHPHGCFEMNEAKAHQIMYTEGVGGKKSINRPVNFKLHSSKIAEFGFANGIIAQCNAVLSQDETLIHQPHGFTTFLPVTVGFDTFKGSGKNYIGQAVHGPGPHPVQDIDKSKTITVSVQVVCVPKPVKAKAPPKIVEAEIGVTTSGNTCPKPAKARVIIATEAPRTVYYKIRRGPVYTTADWIQGETKEVPNLLGSGTSAVLDATHEFGKLDPGHTTYRLVIQGGDTLPQKWVYVECPTFEVLSAWLKYDVEDKATCPKKVVETTTFYTNRPGMVPYEIEHQGGLVVHSGQVQAKRQGDKYIAVATRNLTFKEPFNAEMMADVKNSPANSGWVPLKIDCLEAVSGKLTLQSLGAASCKGEALVAIHTNGAGELPYELECGPGKSWQRKVTAMANKIGVDKVQFDVSNNELVTCVLRTRIGGVLKPLDGGSKTFQCHKPIDTGASVNLVPQTRPDPQKPIKPAVVVDPVKPGPQKPDKPSVVVVDPKPVVSEPKIACANGKVKDGACTCEPHFKPVKAGKNAWRCMRSTADPKPEKPIVSEPKISCAGGKAIKDKCVCGKDMKPVKVSKDAFRCAKATAPTSSTIKADSNKAGNKKAGSSNKADSKPVRTGGSSLTRRTR